MPNNGAPVIGNGVDIILILTGLACLALGGLLMLINLKDLRLAWQSKSWPQTTGYWHDVMADDGEALGLDVFTHAPTQQAYRHSFKVYSYLVENEEYYSGRLSIGGGEMYDRHFEEGEEVTVYYCPTDPSVSVLTPGVTGGLIGEPLSAAIGLGCVLLFCAIRVLGG